MEEHRNSDISEQTFVEGRDFYFEDGLMVLTEQYLSDRGYCCGNECRHCPYGDTRRRLEQEDLKFR